MVNLREPGRSRLPELLLRNHITARDFAGLLDVTEAHISQIINNKRFFSYPLAAKASQLLRCSMEDLHEWD